jgi:Ca2+-binding RTX toxin-like protein
MDVNSIKAAINTATSAHEIKTLLQIATDNNIILDTQFLKDLISQQSIHVQGKNGITLFYSGGLKTDGNGNTVPSKTGGYQAWQVAESIGKNNSAVITIGQTDAYTLLSSDEFYNALDASDPVNISQIMDGETKNGIRTTLGLWDLTSKRMAESAVGEIRTLSPYSLSDKVFAQTELPALLKNKKITSIDGISREHLLLLVNEKGGIGNPKALDAARSAIATQSWIQSLDLEIGLDSSNGQLLVGDRRYFGINSGVTGSDLPAKVVERTTVSKLMDTIHDIQWDTLRLGEENLKRLRVLGQAAGSLGNSGANAADIVSLMIASREAYLAFEAGDSTKAATIISTFAAEFAAGIAAGNPAAMWAGRVSAKIALKSPIGFASATFFTIGIGIMGSLMGESAAKYAIKAGQEFDILMNEASSLVDDLFNNGYTLSDRIASLFSSAQTWVPQRDPLALDLDGDGIETIAQKGWDGVLFDHDNDTVKTATGWVSSDDGLLVLDRNGNGWIDSGGELFGDNTRLRNGALAANGYAALTDLDDNDDGVIDANDAAYADLQVWQDTNQDGISQSDELQSLTQRGIAALSTTGTLARQNQNGNVITHTGTYTNFDGTTGQTVNLDLSNSVFHSDFSETPSLPGADATRVDLHGAGLVRNLRNAAALSPALKTTLDSYSLVTTRDQQLAQLDTLLNQWAATSDMPGLMLRAAENGYIINFNFGNLGPNSTAINQISFADINTEDATSVLNAYRQSQSTDYQTWIDKLTLLERFNGTEFISLERLNTAAAGIITFYDSDGNIDNEATSNLSGFKVVDVMLQQGKLNLLQQSYEELQQSVYRSLLLQTRLEPYLDDISLEFVDGYFQLDFSAMETHFKQAITADNVNGITDLVEFTQMTTSKLSQWDASALVGNSLRTVSMTEAIRNILTEYKIEFLGLGEQNHQAQTLGATVYGNDMANQITGTMRDDTLYGGEGNDTLIGGGGSDILFGGLGNDTLITHFSGNDNILQGGIGNDKLTGSIYADTYLFNLGDGQDVIQERFFRTDNGTVDVLKFGAGITAADISIRRSETDLVLSHNNGSDQVTIKSWYVGSQYQLEQIQFADGTVWDRTAVTNTGLTITGTEGDDTYIGVTAFVDVINGGAGNDTLTAKGNGDHLNGEAGNDTLIADKWGSNTTLQGGTGNDKLTGSIYADTYLFNLGDGQDVIQEQFYYAVTDSIDVLKFGAGITAADISIRRSETDLVLSHNNGSDQVTIKSWYVGTQYQLEQIQFADGTVWDRTAVTNTGLTITGTEGDDTYTGVTAFVDVINGGAGSDTLTAKGNGDHLNGEAGNDTLIADKWGSNTTLQGGTGNDKLTGSIYADTYLFNLGDGQDVIQEQFYYAVTDSIDVLKFGAGITAADISIRRSETDLVLSHNNGSDQVTIKSWYVGTQYQLEQIQFADGTVWDRTAVTNTGLTITGTEGDDTYTGVTAFVDVINGGAGSDTLTAKGNGDHLNGEAGNDTLIADKWGSNTTLQGGTGNDKLTGSIYADTYLFNLGDGQDVIQEQFYYAVTDSIDVLKFGDDINTEQLWFSRNSNDLLIDHIGSDDQVRIKNWFSSENNQIEQISAKNAVLYNNQVINLVNAMALFNAPSGSGAIIPQEVQDQLEPVLAASWTPVT